MFATMRLVRFALVGSALVGLGGCDRPEGADPRTGDPLVRVAEAKVAGQAERSFTGTVSARVQSDLGFRVGGKVTERLVDTGQSVKAGQPLMRIDRNDLELAITSRANAVAAARAVAVQATADEMRYRQLTAAGWATKQKYEEVKSAFDSANAQLAAAEAAGTGGPERGRVRPAARRRRRRRGPDPGGAGPGRHRGPDGCQARTCRPSRGQCQLARDDAPPPRLGGCSFSLRRGERHVTGPPAAAVRRRGSADTDLRGALRPRGSRLPSAPLGATVTIRVPSDEVRGEHGRRATRSPVRRRDLPRACGSWTRGPPPLPSVPSGSCALVTRRLA